MKLTLTLCLLLSLGGAARWRAPSPQPSPPPHVSQTPTPTPRPLTWWEKALRIAGISTTPRNQRGETSEITGDIWVATLDASLRSTLRRPVTSGGGFRSPIFTAQPDQVLALRGETIVSVSLADMRVDEVAPVPGIIKIVGQDTANPDEVLVVTDVDRDKCPGLSMFSLADKRLTPLPYDNTDLDTTRVNHIVGWEREYGEGNEKVTLHHKVEQRNRDGRVIEWQNVYLKPRGANAINVSLCNEVYCVQPSLSSNRQAVAYIKAAP